MPLLFLLLALFVPTSANAGNTTKDIACLATNIYFEARNQSYEGQKAVAFVTLNRVHSSQYPNNVCEVVWQPKQFSWTIDGKSNKPKDIASFKIATALAIQVYNKYNQVNDPTKGALMFHANYVRPYWRQDYKISTIIGDHIFYVEK
jgi:spore germination cell wall hydrolase CwlJ-like protein